LKDKICVVGLGYVGLPTALILAKYGFNVSGVDSNKNKIIALQKGFTLIEDARPILKEKTVKKNFKADIKIKSADVFIVAVPTPLSRNHKADLKFLKQAIRSICTVIKKGNLVIIESTIPPGTCRNIVIPIIEKNTNLKVSEDFLLAHCPERAIPTNTIYEIVHNDRIIGGIDKISTEKTDTIYKSFVKGKIHKTNDITAELTKLAENAYRDVNIAFANEIDSICSKLDINTSEVISLANKHPRVNILVPGIGVGGHCIPIDPLFISEIFPKNSKMIKMARKINDLKPSSISKQIFTLLKEIKNPEIVVAGISYKKNVNDIRESPALKIIELLEEKNIKVSIYDPIVYPKQEGKLIKFCKQKDLLIILVSHDIILKEFKKSEKQIRTMLKINKVLAY
jgi:UDP-N-acetyl-D-mannosaminuronic acid dehydrogenase